MAVGLVDRQKLVNIADAVRAKKGITGNMTLDGIVSNIASIPTADNNAKYDFSGSGSKSSGSLVEYLTSIDLSNFDTSNYTDMNGMFSGYKNLKSIDVSGLDTRNVTNMGSMFKYCSSLKNLTLGENWASNSGLDSFDLSSCPLTRESAVDVINKLATRSNSPVIKFSGKVGLYQSEIDIATNKGWSVSGCLVLIEDPSTATVGQYAIIDGEMSKCVYVADEPQSWGQRIFFYDSNVGESRQWGGYGTSTGVTDTAIGTGLSNTNALLAMNLQSTVGSPTLWDDVTKFRSTHSDRWFVPSKEELGKIMNSYSNLYTWSSTELNANYAYRSNPYSIPNTIESIKSNKNSTYVCTYV